MAFFNIDRVETGNRILKYRKANHLTRERLAAQLSDETGRPTAAVSVWKWETARCDITEEYARALAEIFGCRVCELIVAYLSYYDDERDQLAPLIITYLTTPNEHLLLQMLIFLLIHG